MSLCVREKKNILPYFLYQCKHFEIGIRAHLDKKKEFENNALNRHGSDENSTESEGNKVAFNMNIYYEAQG